MICVSLLFLVRASNGQCQHGKGRPHQAAGIFEGEMYVHIFFDIHSDSILFNIVYSIIILYYEIQWHRYPHPILGD